MSLRNAADHIELLSLRAMRTQSLPPVDRGTKAPQPDVRNSDAGGASGGIFGYQDLDLKKGTWPNGQAPGLASLPGRSSL